MEAQTRPSHGTKRSADDGLEGEQRLSKRFDLLNLDHNGKLFIPVASQSLAPLDQAPSTRPKPVSRPRQADDWMQIEDTRDKIYIHNLDEELASDEETPEAERIVFLPDIEKQLAKLPDHILKNPSSGQGNPGNQLVIYRVPSSITIPEEKDSVRKAIIESRARARHTLQEDWQPLSASQDCILHDVESDVVTEAEEMNADEMDVG